MDWMESIEINNEFKITFLPAVHWSKRSLTDTNKIFGKLSVSTETKKFTFLAIQVLETFIPSLEKVWTN